MAAHDAHSADGDVGSLYRRHSRSLRAFLLHKTHGDQDRAEDLLQDVFLAAVADLERRPANTPVLAWLYTVAHRRFVDDVRRRGRRVETVPRDDLAGPRDAEYGPAVSRAMVIAVRELTAVQQKVFTLKVLEGRSFHEIAEQIGISEGAARNHLMRALKSIRATFETYGLNP
jgi:RNA polymerase sigma-70 factor (ECF subfamily)